MSSTPVKSPPSEGIATKRERLSKVIVPLMRCIHCFHGDLELLSDSLRCKSCGTLYPVNNDIPIMLKDPKAAYDYTQANVTEHHYSGSIGDMLQAGRHEIALDLGAGNNIDTVNRVIKLDIFAFPSVDIVGVAENLPFKDGVFDLVVSGAVFEHVFNPFEASNSLNRIIKSGGEVYVETAFLQPEHAYPNHFFNMTVSGASYLFSNFQKLETGVRPYQNPSFALYWILHSWSLKLQSADREKFLNATVQEIITEYEQKPFSQRWLEGFKPRDLEELACGVYFHGRKGNATVSLFANSAGLSTPQIRLSAAARIKDRAKQFTKRTLSRLGLLEYVKRKR